MAVPTFNTTVSVASKAAFDVFSVREFSTNHAFSPNWRTFKRQLPSTRNRTYNITVNIQTTQNFQISNQGSLKFCDLPLR